MNNICQEHFDAKNKVYTEVTEFRQSNKDIRQQLEIVDCGKKFPKFIGKQNTYMIEKLNFGPNNISSSNLELQKV